MHKSERNNRGSTYVPFSHQALRTTFHPQEKTRNLSSSSIATPASLLSMQIGYHCHKHVWVWENGRNCYLPLEIPPKQSVLVGHSETITSITLFPSGKNLSCGSRERNSQPLGKMWVLSGNLVKLNYSTNNGPFNCSPNYFSSSWGWRLQGTFKNGFDTCWSLERFKA